MRAMSDSGLSYAEKLSTKSLDAEKSIGELIVAFGVEQLDFEVRFISNDSAMILVAGEDRTLYVWQYMQAIKPFPRKMSQIGSCYREILAQAIIDEAKEQPNAMEKRTT